MEIYPVSVSEVMDAVTLSVPWKVTLAYEGPNGHNRCGTSSKWWACSGSGLGECTCEINFGKTGSSGLSTPLRASLSQVMKALQEKLAKGYKFARPTPNAASAELPTPNAALAELPKPFCDIVSFVLVEHVTLASPYFYEHTVNALDQGGRVLMRLQVATALDLCRKYGIRVVSAVP